MDLQTNHVQKVLQVAKVNQAKMVNTVQKATEVLPDLKVKLKVFQVWWTRW